MSDEVGWTVCGEAKDGSEAIQKARELLPDVILLDISMPDISGFDVARLLRQELPNAKLLVISQHDPFVMLPLVIEAGCDACLDKRSSRRGFSGNYQELGVETSSGSRHVA